MVGDFLFCFAREVSCQRATRQVRKKTDGRRDHKEEKTTTKESLSGRRDEKSRQKTKKVERTNKKP